MNLKAYLLLVLALARAAGTTLTARASTNACLGDGYSTRITYDENTGKVSDPALYAGGTLPLILHHVHGAVL